MAKQFHSEQTEKSSLANLTPAEFAGMGKKRIEVFVNPQTVRSETDLAYEFASKLTRGRSTEDAMTARQATLGRGPKPQPCAEGVGIGPLVFRCPTTAHDIESGIEMDLQTFRRIGHLSVRLPCRGCGRPHELKVADGCLVSYRMPPCVGDLYRPDVSAEEHTIH